jgi:hypothetical protein
MSDIIIYTVVGGGATTIAVISLFAFLFKNPDKFEHWMAIFDRLLLGASDLFPKFRGKLDRRAVTSSIQDTVNGICERIDKEAPDILPHALKIEWLQSESPDAFIKNGKAWFV